MPVFLSSVLTVPFPLYYPRWLLPISKLQLQWYAIDFQIYIYISVFSHDLDLQFQFYVTLCFQNISTWTSHRHLTLKRSNITYMISPSKISPLSVPCFNKCYHCPSSCLRQKLKNHLLSSLTLHLHPFTTSIHILNISRTHALLSIFTTITLIQGTVISTLSYTTAP